MLSPDSPAVEDIEQRPFIVIDDVIHPDLINLGLPDNFPVVAVEDVDVDGGDVVIWGIPVDRVTGFCGKGDVVWVEGHFSVPTLAYRRT